MKRVVVTGIGAVTPLGNSAQESWQAVLNNECGIDFIKSYDTTNSTIKIAGEVKNFDPSKYLSNKETRVMDKFSQYAVCASLEALEDSGINSANENSYRLATIISSGIGGMQTIEEEYIRGTQRGFDKVSPYYIPKAISNMAAGNVAIKTGFNGISYSMVTACAGGTNAIGEAYRNIKHGYYDCVIAGGTEACVTEFCIGGFTSMRALSKNNDPNYSSIPFDKNRNGFVMGEGAASLVLEELDHALARGAKIYAEIIGYGANCDANHITAPVEDGHIAAACIKSAIDEANIDCSKIDYINAHGTSTPLNDVCESRAINSVFGLGNKVLVSSTKSMTGHLLGAAGAVEGMLLAKSLQEGFVPGTINTKEVDENCNINIVLKGEYKPINYGLSTSLGFGGHNACIVMKKYEA